ncbi:unnamed protein product [Urochloa humidicola]
MSRYPPDAASQIHAMPASASIADTMEQTGAPSMPESSAGQIHYLPAASTIPEILDSTAPSSIPPSITTHPCADKIHGMGANTEVANSIERTAPCATIPSMATSAEVIEPATQDSPTTAQDSSTSMGKVVQPFEEEEAPAHDFNRLIPHEDSGHPQGNGHGDEEFEPVANCELPENSTSAVNRQRHAIKVLTHLDRRQIPKRNILKRWTKWYDEENKNRDYLTQLAIENDDLKKKALISKAFELANKEAKISNLTFQETTAALTHAVNCSATIEKSAEIGNNDNQGLTGHIPTSCPPSTFKGGQHPSTGRRSWLDSINKEKRQKSGEAEKQASD